MLGFEHLIMEDGTIPQAYIKTITEKFFLWRIPEGVNKYYAVTILYSLIIIDPKINHHAGAKPPCAGFWIPNYEIQDHSTIRLYV